MGYSNSNLVSYTCLSPNHSGKRNHVIDTISIHCMAGNLTVETCGRIFQNTNRQASSNYGIGSDGRIALYVEEKNRSWCTSSYSNDQRAITIEVANDGGASTGWHVSPKAMAALIDLLADICSRNDIKELKWVADKSLIGQTSKQNMTVHRWFAAKACPGDYLYKMHTEIVKQVNNKLKGLIELTMTKEELKEFIETTVRSMGKDAPADDWAVKELNQAVEMGITDGSRPKSYATREEAAIMVKRSLEKVS